MRIRRAGGKGPADPPGSARGSLAHQSRLIESAKAETSGASHALELLLPIAQQGERLIGIEAILKHHLGSKQPWTRMHAARLHIVGGGSPAEALPILESKLDGSLYGRKALDTLMTMGKAADSCVTTLKRGITSDRRMPAVKYGENAVEADKTWVALCRTTLKRIRTSDR